MTYKPVKGYCVLYPEEIKKLASEGTGRRSVYSSAPCFAIYLALRQRAWNTPTNWWRTFVSYETLALDLGWDWDLSTKKSIERALRDLQEMGMILYTKGSKATAIKDGRANDYSLVFYKHIRELRQGGSKKTPVSPTKDTSVLEKDTSVSNEGKIGDMGVAPINKHSNKQNKKHSLLTNERQRELESLFGRESTPESEDQAFKDFMGDQLHSDPSIFNKTTDDYDTVEIIKEKLLKNGWDWSFLLRDYDIEDVETLLGDLPPTMDALKGQVRRATSRITVGLSSVSEEIKKLTPKVK